MQIQYDKDVFGEPEPFDEKKMKVALKNGAFSASVFEVGSKAHEIADNNYKIGKKHFNALSKNQQRRLRKKGYGA